jgi:hypothetical protein
MDCQLDAHTLPLTSNLFLELKAPIAKAAATILDKTATIVVQEKEIIATSEHSYLHANSGVYGVKLIVQVVKKAVYSGRTR